MAAYAGHVLIYGGKGALGSVLVDFFRAKNYWIASIDLFENPAAHSNVVLKGTSNSWTEQETEILTGVSGVIPPETRLDAVLCVAGGWAGGNAASSSFIKSSELMWKQSVWSSCLAAQLASKYLSPKGSLVLVGAAAALQATPGMVGYGMAKAAVHQLTRSLGAEKSGLPAESFVSAILPETLDTEANRKSMPKADFSKWTPLSFVADLLGGWIEGRERPASGSLVQLVTREGKTELVIS